MKVNTTKISLGPLNSLLQEKSDCEEVLDGTFVINGHKVTKEIVAKAEGKKIDLIYKLSFMATFATIVGIIMICVILWPVTNHYKIMIWSGLLSVVITVRMALFYMYNAAKPSAKKIVKWEKPHETILTISTAIWGIGAVALMPQGSLLHQVILLCFLLGMAGGAIGVYLPNKTLMLVIVSLFLLPAAIWFALQATFITAALSIGCIEFLITAIKVGKEFNKRLSQSFLLTQVLEEAYKEVETKAHTDALTEMNNRRALEIKGEEMERRIKSISKEMSVIIIDIDHFKRINDTYGHVNGDMVLKQVSSVIKKAVRDNDISARVGGEEFALVLMVNNKDEAVRIAKKLCKKIERSKITVQDKNERVIDVKVTASFGVSCGKEGLEKLYEVADKMLYEAKETGRNCVRVAA